MNDLFMRDVVFSIKPRFVDLIKSREKTQEFRNYVPKSGVRFVYIYMLHLLLQK